MIAEICSDPSKVMMLMLGLKLVDGAIEYWLGKTEKVKAGSVLELILNGLRFLVKLLARKK